MKTFYFCPLPNLTVLWHRPLYLMAVFVAGFSAHGQPSTEVATGEAAEKGAIKRPTATDSASRQLIENYLTVVGGKDAFGAIRAVEAVGELNEAGDRKRFRLIETADGKRHLTLTWRLLGREYEERFVFDGVEAWQQVLAPEAEPAKDFGGPAAAHFSHQHWLLQPFVLPARADYVFQYEGNAWVGSRAAHLVVGYGKKDERTWFYFDRENFLLLRWGGYGPVGGIQEVLDYRATKFKRSGGILFPEAIELLAEDAPFGRATFQRIRINPPLGDLSFLRPVQTSPMLRQRPVAR